MKYSVRRGGREAPCYAYAESFISWRRCSHGLSRLPPSRARPVHLGKHLHFLWRNFSALWAMGERRRRLTFFLSQVTISCKHQDNKTSAMGKMSEMNASAGSPAAVRGGPGRKDTRGMRLLRRLSFASWPCRYCPPALSAGEVYVEGFCRGEEEEEGSFPQKHPGICQKRDRKEKKKKKGDREWERQGPLTNE